MSMAANTDPSPRCWCGNTDLTTFSTDYFKCNACGGTLIAKIMPSAEISAVQDEAESYYGQNYWFEHQQSDLQQPDILSRARSDLSERVLYWTRTLLHYKTPPSNLFELGSGHGGFVAMLRVLGYDATGSELSPSIVDLARQLFDIPVVVGTVEEQGFQPSSFNVIALMDVLEHLTNPFVTMEYCSRLLKSDGVIFAQTPAFPANLSYAEMVINQHPFLRMMIPTEHLFLFSKESVTELLRRLGIAHIVFEEPMFAHYDMFFIASRQPIIRQSADEIRQFLEASPNGRLIQAMLDLADREKQWFDAFQRADNDRIERLRQIKELTHLLQESEADRAARLELLNNANDKISRLHEHTPSAQQPGNRDQEIYQVNRLVQQLVTSYLTFSTLANYLQPDHNPLLRNTKRNRPPFSFSEFSRAATQVVKQRRATAGEELKCIVIDLIPVLPGSENGGAKIFTLQLVKDLIRLLPECKFILVTSDVTHSELAVLDAPNVIRYCVYHRTKPLDAKTSQRLIEMMERWFKIDLLFCPFTLPIFTLSSVPIVSVIYDLQYLYYPEFFSGAEIEERDRNFREAVAQASYLTCISEHVRQTVLKNAQIPPERVRTIYLSASPHTSSKSDDIDILPLLGLSPDSYWLYPANFWQHKNHLMLVTAFGIYCHRQPNSTLKLVCTGTPNQLMKDLQQYVKLMQLEDRVVFPGFLSPDEFSDLLNNAYALVFPSLYEGFGMPILEAMAAGKPVLCSNVTSLPEVAGDAAIYFDPRKPDEIARAMERLEQEPELTAALIRRGEARINAFGNTESIARHYIDLFREVAANSSQTTYVTQGIYSDGWVGETLALTYEACDMPRTLQAEFRLLTGAPDRQTTIVVAERGMIESYTLESGSSTIIERSLSPLGGAIEVLFYPQLNSTRFQDKRSLTCQCGYFRVVSPDESLELFGAEA